MIREKDSKLSEINLPQERYILFYKILLNVFEKEPLLKSLEKCNVHTCPELPVDHIVLLIQKDEKWAQPLKGKNRFTDKPAVNKLIKEHDLLISLVDWDDSHDGLIINSAHPINMSALAVKIQNEIGQVKISRTKLEGVSNDIQIEKITDGWKVTYIYRFGGSFGGSFKEHFWVFKYLSKSGEVEFIEESGDQLPDWVPCKI